MKVDLVLHANTRTGMAKAVSVLFCLLFLLQPLLLVNAGELQALQLTPRQHEYAVSPVSQYLEDPDGHITIEQLLQDGKAFNWQPVINSYRSFGFSDSTFWFRFNLINLKAAQSDHVIEIPYSLLDNITFYLVQDGMVRDIFITGDSLPFNERAYEFQTFVYKPSSLPEEQLVSIYVKVKSKSSLLVPIQLWNEHEFYAHQFHTQIINGLYFGVLLVFIIYNLQLLLFTREAVYFFYALYILAFGLFQTSLSGIGYQYLWPKSTTFQHFSPTLFMLVALFAALRFAHHFLKLKLNCPQGWLMMQMMSVAALLLVAALPFFAYSIITQAALFLTMMTGLALTSAAVVVWIRVRGEAEYFLFGWIIFIVSVAISVSQKLGWADLGAITDQVIQLGLIVQLVIFSQALAKRLYTETQQRIILQQQTTEDLENQVKARTKELEEANRKLAVMGHTDGLTGLSNRRFFDKELDRQFKSAIRTGTPLSLAMLDIDYFKRINDEFGHQVGDDFLRHISTIISTELKRPIDTASRYGGEEFALILPGTTRVGAISVAENIRKNVENFHHNVNEKWVPVTISIGIASAYPEPGDNLEHMIKQADTALYQAKQEGRNRTIAE